MGVESGHFQGSRRLEMSKCSATYLCTYGDNGTWLCCQRVLQTSTVDPELYPGTHPVNGNDLVDR